MSDPVSAARAARENLARGLGALQTPGVPPQLMSVAEPVAHAMSALHRIESTGGAAVVEAGPAALHAARAALATLQVSAGQHPAVDQALEAIAGSLSLIHGLAQPAQVASPPQQAYPAQPAAQNVGPATQPSQAMAYQPRPEAAPQVSYAQPAAAAYQAPAAPAYQAPAAPAAQLAYTQTASHSSRRRTRSAGTRSRTARRVAHRSRARRAQQHQFLQRPERQRRDRFRRHLRRHLSNPSDGPAALASSVDARRLRVRGPGRGALDARSAQLRLGRPARLWRSVHANHARGSPARLSLRQESRATIPRRSVSSGGSMRAQ